LFFFLYKPRSHFNIIIIIVSAARQFKPNQVITPMIDIK